MTAFEALQASGQLPTRVWAMVSARDVALSRAWLAKGPTTGRIGMLNVRSVKAYYDGSLGSRGARLLEDYADMKGHRGVSGSNYGASQPHLRGATSPHVKPRVRSAVPCGGI